MKWNPIIFRFKLPPTLKQLVDERIWLVAFIGLAGLLLAYPLWADGYSLNLVRDMLIFGIVALSLDWLWGKGGMLSFGHAAFFGIGAYSMAITSINLDWGFSSLLGLFASVAIPGIIALLIGYFLIFAGVRGAYFVIVTLAIGIVSQQAAISWVSVTGGDSGLLGIPPLGFTLGDHRFQLDNSLSLYYVVLTVALLSLLFLWQLSRGLYGNLLKGIENNEKRAQSLGHNTSLHLLIVMISSAMLAGLAGGLYASCTGFVAPDLLSLMLSTEIFVWVAVGGRGTLLGPFIGAFIIMRLQQVVSSISTGLWPLVIGAIFIIIVFVFPDGILPFIRKFVVRFKLLFEKSGVKHGR
ncbi:MAG: branched-chain amino acid ABC transporter permease [Desulfobacterales bacterium]|nr:branched-chain amino acid ABC transporter permease [Desulfobacterales bacterium]